MADQIDAETLKAEQLEIEKHYRTLKFTQEVRHKTLACTQTCGGEVAWPFRMDPDKSMIGTDKYNCFTNCLNEQFETGPFLRNLGTIPQNAVPKKFIWVFGDNLTETPESQ